MLKRLAGVFESLELICTKVGDWSFSNTLEKKKIVSICQKNAEKVKMTEQVEMKNTNDPIRELFIQ